MIVTDGQPCTSTPVYVTVTVNPTPTITITGGASSLCSGSSATLTASGGNTYSWYTPSSTSSVIIVTPTTSTSYTVAGTNTVTGCANTGTVTVNVNALPNITVAPVSSICTGSNATLSASGGNTYSWYTPSSTAAVIIVSPTSSTTYTVAGTNTVTGCSNTATGTVNVNALPSVSIAPVGSLCAGQNTTLSASGGDTYSWYTPSSTAAVIIVSPTTSTTYTVAGTNTVTGCSNTGTATVNVNALPAISVTPVTSICTGSNATLTASGGNTYSWYSPSSTGSVIIVSPTTATSYTVAGTNSVTGCSNTAVGTVTITPQASANAGPDVSICTGSTTTLNAIGNGTFVWSPATGLNNTTISNPAADPTVTTTYTVTVTNACGSTTDEVQVSITTAPSVNAGTDATICPGGNTTLIASGSGTYAWSPATGLSNTTIANPVASPTTTTNYTVTVTDVCGTASDVVVVNVSTPTATITAPASICSGSSATLTASGGGTYSWSTGLTTGSIIVSPTAATGYTVTVTNSIGCTDNDIVTVNVNALPAPVISGNTTICSGVNTTLSASGGTNYSWNTGLTTSSIVVNPTAATGYTVTVTDVNGCSNTANAQLTVNPLPAANAGTDPTICSGNSTTLSATGNGSYNWSPSTGLSNTTIANPVANPTATTNYTVAVTNSCGTATDVVTVNVNATPSVTVTGDATVCSGAGDTLIATGGGTYLWNTSSTNDSLYINPTSTTGYTVTVTSASGCTSVGTFTVNASSVTAAITGASLICSGQSSTLTASGGGTYSWSTGSTATTIIVSPTTGTNYTVTATNTMGCTAASTFSVGITAQPTASVTATTTTICFGSPTSLNASGGTTYVWSPSAGLNNTTIANPVANPTSATTYTVIVSSGTCADTASILIGVNPVPTATLSVSAASICVGGCATLSASGGASYSWAPGGQTISAITACPTSATNYTVIATDANGCTDNATTLINVLPTVSVTISPNTTICMGAQTTLTAQGGGIYIWNPGGQTTSGIAVSPVSSTTYTVVASNGACSDTDSVTVNVNPIPTVIAVADPYSILFGNSTTLTGTSSAGSYNWSPVTGLSCAACSNPVASPTTTTTYTLVTVDGNGCSSMDTVIVNVNLECGDIFVPSAFSPNNDGHNDYFRVRVPVPCIKTIDIVIYNRWGQKVFETEDMTQVWDGTIHGKNADPAVFFYIINLELVSKEFRTLEGSVTLVK